MMTTMLGRPPYRTALIGKTPKHEEESRCDRSSFECRMRGVTVKTDGHADVNFDDCNGGGESKCDLRCEVVEARAEEEGGDEGGHDDYAVERLANEEGCGVVEEENSDEGFEVGGGEVSGEDDDGTGDVDCHADHIHLHASSSVPWKARCSCSCGSRLGSRSLCHFYFILGCRESKKVEAELVPYNILDIRLCSNSGIL